MSRSLRATLVAAASIVVVAAAGFLWLRFRPRAVPAGQPPLVTLAGDGLPAFRDAVDRCSEETCVLVLLSPT